MNKLGTICSFLFLALSLVTYQSCSGRGADQTEAYAGPGSDWRANINFDGTFTFVEEDTDLTLTGDWVPQTGPFKKFTVRTSTNTGSVAVGSEAFGLDIPGVAFLLKPVVNASDPIITMVTKGGCPSEDATMNWIITNETSGANITTSDIFGQFQYTHSSVTANLLTRYNLAGSDLGGNNLGTFDCNDSIATLSSDANVKMYINNVGALVNTGASFIIGFIRQAIGSVDTLEADNYYGLVFKESSGATSTVKASLTGTTLTVQGIETETGALTGSNNLSLTVDSVDQPKEGFMKMTLGSDNIRCMANADVYFSGKKLIFCVGKDPDGANTDLFNLLLITE